MHYLLRKYQIRQHRIRSGKIESIQRDPEEYLNKRHYLILAVVDMSSQTMVIIGLVVMPASLYLLARAFVILFITAMSMAVLGRAYHRHHLFSLFLIVGGIFVTGFSTIQSEVEENNENGYHREEMYIGLGLIISGQILESILYILYEVYQKANFLYPLEVIGWQGVFCSTIYLIILVILYFVKCGNYNFCPYGRIEDGWDKVLEQDRFPILVVYGIAYIIFIALFNLCFMNVIKMKGAAVKVSVDMSRILVVYLFFCVYAGESEESFRWVSLAGYVLVGVGTLVYNEILEVPVLG